MIMRLCAVSCSTFFWLKFPPAHIKIIFSYSIVNVFIKFLCIVNVFIIMENIESSWNILMVINFKILQSKYFNDKFSTYIL